MKKLILALLLVFAASSLGQTVTAPQIKKKTNGGITGDSTGALAVGVYRGTSAPASPVTGQLWCDTTYTPCIQKVYSGSAWEAQTAVTILTQDNLSAFPANPVDGQVSWVENQKRAIVYSAADQKWYYLDSQGRAVASDYILGSAYPTDFLTAPGATTGSVTSGGSVTAGTHVCATTFYNSVGGETMPGTATPTLTSGSPNQTLSLTIPTGGTGTTGRKIYCSKANTTTPLLYVGRVADNTTGTYAVTVADTSFTGHTPPDVDLSASIPTGFSFRAKDVGLDGCGSTGSSIVCYTHDATNIGTSTTAWGPRLEYAISGNPDDWVARWHITRWDCGFAGRTSSCSGTASTPYLHVGLTSVLASDANVPAAHVWTIANTSAAIIMPFISTRTPIASRWTRAADSAASVGSNSVGGAIGFPPIQSQDFYVSIRGHWEDPNWTYAMRGGPIQGEQNGWLDVNADATATWCENGYCSATEMTRIGVVHFERVHGGTAGAQYQVIEFSDFTFTAE